MPNDRPRLEPAFERRLHHRARLRTGAGIKPRPVLPGKATDGNGPWRLKKNGFRDNRP